MQHIALTKPIDFTLSLTIGAAITLKEQGLLDIFALPGSAEEFTRIISDRELFPRVLWQLTDQSCDFATFRAMVQQSEQEPLWDAFRDELFAFFHAPTWKEIVSLANAANESANEKPSRSPNSLTTNDEPNDNENSTDHGTAFGNSPESLVSILETSHTDSLSGWPMAANALNGLAQAG